MTVLNLDLASAVAAGKCLMSRLWKPGMAGGNPGAYHPRPCAWEGYTASELARIITDHNDAGGYDPRTERYRSIPVERFRALSSDHQARLVRAAQYPDEVTR